MLVAKAIAASASAAKVYVENVFSTWLYTGNASTQTITNDIDLSGKGGLVWTKSRSTTFNNTFYDTARGATKALFSNATDGEATVSTGLTSFSNSGYVLGSHNGVNNNATTYASWTFREQAKFFDVVTWTGSGANRTIAHSLGSVPGCIIVKRTDTTGDWQVYHRSLANTEYLVLNTTAAKATGTTRWNSTTPTSTEFSLGTDATVNASGGTYVAYLFAHDAGGFGDSGNDSIVKCGSYTGNGGTQSIDLGWEAQWLLVKRTDSTGNWVLYDNMRGAPNGGDDNYLFPNLSDGENTYGNVVHFDARGFSFVSGISTLNASGGNYIYIAIRRGPMKTPTDATKVFTAANATANGTTTTWTTNFPVDLALFRLTAFTQSIGFFAHDRMRGELPYDFGTASTAAETNIGTKIVNFDLQTTFTERYGNTNGRNLILEAFRRAPGFFDVVAYTGTGVARTVSHNLGVVPELMIIKQRNTARWWPVYSASLTYTHYLNLQGNDASAAVAAGFELWNNTTPTSTAFSVGPNTAVNESAGTYIAYLFASCPGVSKIGSYTGSGTTKQIDCGFTAGARFVLIKRTDSTGDWYVWDSARGIVAGNDPYLLLNSTAAEVTNTDYVDTYSLGFELSSTAPAAINANGGSYIFLAIA